MYVHPKSQRVWPPIPFSRYLDNSLLAPLLRFIAKRYIQSGGRYPRSFESEVAQTQAPTKTAA
jgi:hypothetical protein